jgi:hypothetical protein
MSIVLPLILFYYHCHRVEPHLQFNNNNNNNNNNTNNNYDNFVPVRIILVVRYFGVSKSNLEQ